MKIISVSHLNEQISLLLQEGFSESVIVEGEISNFSAAASGHWYFTLKDEQSQIKAVMFKRNNYGIPLPQNGDKVQVFADVSFYKGRGDCQLICKSITQHGIGELLAKLEALKKKLADEGLFSAEHKKPLPFFPQSIGIVASAQSAALQDMLKIFRQYNAPLTIYLFPCMVQGENSGQDIANKISQAIAFSANQTPLDAIIVSRGGGSTEDLITFSDERVVRTIYSSPVPIITGIGHEIDQSLSDLVADCYQPTPTAAATLICSRFVAIKEKLSYISDSLDHIFQTKCNDFARIIEEYSPTNLQSILINNIRETRQHIDIVSEVIRDKVLHKFNEEKQKILRFHEALETMSPHKILSKGFVYIKDANTQNIISSIEQTSPDLPIEITFHDGAKHAIIK